MVIEELKDYWALCKVYRRAEDPHQRNYAFSLLKEMREASPNKRKFRFFNPNRKVVLRTGPNESGC